MTLFLLLRMNMVLPPLTFFLTSGRRFITDKWTPKLSLSPITTFDKILLDGFFIYCINKISCICFTVCSPTMLLFAHSLAFWIASLPVSEKSVALHLQCLHWLLLIHEWLYHSFPHPPDLPFRHLHFANCHFYWILFPLPRLDSGNLLLSLQQKRVLNFWGLPHVVRSGADSSGLFPCLYMWTNHVQTLLSCRILNPSSATFFEESRIYHRFCCRSQRHSVPLYHQHWRWRFVDASFWEWRRSPVFFFFALNLTFPPLLFSLSRPFLCRYSA